MAEPLTPVEIAEWLVNLSVDLRSVGDLKLVRISDDGVTDEPLSLADELWLVASAVDWDAAMARSAYLERRKDGDPGSSIPPTTDKDTK